MSSDSTAGTVETEEMTMSWMLISPQSYGADLLHVSTSVGLLI
jgi:hypothetical protein